MAAAAKPWLIKSVPPAILFDTSVTGMGRGSYQDIPALWKALPGDNSVQNAHHLLCQWKPNERDLRLCLVSHTVCSLLCV